MAPTPSILIRKQLPRRGGTVLWSNRYHFNGGTPSDLAHWNALADAIVAAEKAIHPPAVQIVEAVYYGAGSDLPVGSKAYTTAGTASFGGNSVPSDVAAVVRHATTARTSKNHPVYLFSYVHGIPCKISDADQVESTAKTALETYYGQWVGAGFSDGVNTYHRAGPNGATAVDTVVKTYLSHRDFPR